MKDYKNQKDYMFRIRAANHFGISEPSMSASLVAKPGEFLNVTTDNRWFMCILFSTW